MKTRKLKYFIHIYKWQAAVQHEGFKVPGEWTGPYSRQYKTLLDRAHWLKKERQALVDATASDGHPLYRLEFSPK